jgi:hypothetical protein
MKFDDWWATLTPAEQKVIGRTNAKFVWLEACAAEREACAKICETLWNFPENGMATEEECYGAQCADAIRARG